MEKNIEKLKLADKKEEQNEKSVNRCRMCNDYIDESLTGFCGKCGKEMLMEKNEDIVILENKIDRIKNKRDEKNIVKRMRWEEELKNKVDNANDLLDLIKKENK